MALSKRDAKFLQQGGYPKAQVRTKAGQAGSISNDVAFVNYVYMGVPPKEAKILAYGSPTAKQKRKALRHAGLKPKHIELLITASHA